MNDTPAPLSADSLREQIEEAAMYGFIEGAYDIHGIPIQSIDKLEALIAAALQSQRQRIADSLPPKYRYKHNHDIQQKGDTYICLNCKKNVNDIVGNDGEGECPHFRSYNEAIEAVRAVLIPPRGEPGGLETPDTASAGGNQVDNPLEPQ